MKSKLLLVLISGMMLFALTPATAQTCSAPNDNQNTSYSGNRWYAYFYRNEDFTSYHGRATYGSGTYGNFDEDFQGSNVNYDPDWDLISNTFNCSLPTETFSVRLRQTRNFTAGTYDFTVGADDGVRLYVDGNLIIDEWQTQVYATFTMPYYMSAGNHTLVIEYYESNGENRLRYNCAPAACVATGTTTATGTNNVWRAYFYDGKNFETFRGSSTAGVAASPLINTNFGGDLVTISGITCPILSETFSVRYRLNKTFAAGTYLFTIGGDDGHRLSLDGGATWLISNWHDQGFGTSAVVRTFAVNTTVNMVLEYYENHQGNQVFFDVATTLPVSLVKFEGRLTNNESTLNWQVTPESTEDYFEVERSTDGRQYNKIGTVSSTQAVAAVNGNRQYNFRDPNPVAGNGFYRLKIIDKSGPAKYSSIININTQSTSKAKIYPTIIDQNKLLFIQSDRSATDAEVSIRNISGQPVLIKKLGTMTRGQIATLPLQDAALSKGTYMVLVLAGGAVMHRQLITVP
ncbi:MAG: PA14 domain-containing protein [Pseudobacter sp.]|uniref:PA14 domain-containing protein n=1 Tax=Pseudobacter sp. TaxID=2045420 RepID=UPI003F7CD9FC